MTSLTEARELLRQGRIPEAERAYQRILERSPGEPEALCIVGLSALRAGQAARATALLGAAARLEPRNAVTHQHLGRAQEASGDPAGALASYRAALQLQPELHVARLQLAAALERAGERASATIQYARALEDAQSQGRWLNPDTTPAALRPLVEAAVLAVRRGTQEAYARLLEPLASRYGRAALARVERCIRIYLHEEEAAYPDPRQRPMFLFFPGLPASAYLDRSLFAWLPQLEAATDAIRAELQALLPSTTGRERVFTSDELEQANLRGLDQPPSWNGYYFWRHGEGRADNRAACPATAAALASLPLSHVRGHGPEVLFSVFTPGTHLLPHRGVTNSRLVGHLPLLVPADCALKVGGELHHWQEGRVVVFDDTYEHEAWNRSARTRVVLIFDLWNPYLTEVERLAVADLVGAIGDFGQAAKTA